MKTSGCPVNPVLVTRTLQCRGSMPSPPTAPPGALSGCLCHMAGSMSMIHGLVVSTGTEDLTPHPPSQAEFPILACLLVIEDSAVTLLPFLPRAQALTTLTSNPIHGCSHFSPSLSLCQAGPNHTGPSPPPWTLLPKTLLSQPWPGSSAG